MRDTIAEKAKVGDRDASEDLTYLLQVVHACCKYVDAVNAFMFSTTTARIVSVSDYRNIFEENDKRRHAAHENAIVRVNVLNRMCRVYGVSPVYLGDEDNRYQIGDFCGELVNEIFVARAL